MGTTKGWRRGANPTELSKGRTALGHGAHAPHACKGITATAGPAAEAWAANHGAKPCRGHA